jgi:diguanylate cyclase (GGDEF)-like protein
VISLKKLIDSNREELLHWTLRAYRAALEAMGSSAVTACPHLGMQLQLGLGNLQRQLAEEAAPGLVQETETRVAAELQQWGERSAEYYRRKTEEFKEIMMIMARTAESVGDRDQRYSKRFTEFTTRLHSLASLDDLTTIRDSLVSSANELQAGVNQMAQDGEEAVAQMRGQLRQYEAKLEEAERLASLDSLTGLENRRRMEAVLQFRVARGRPFSVAILDLNAFKQVNDTYGHVAGDEVLKQFATELKAAFRATDDVGRWGGDEFIVVLDCGLEDAHRHVERIRKWVFGDYEVRGDGQPRKLHVDAAVGLATWKEGETTGEMFARADADMYKEKKAVKPPANGSGRESGSAAGFR